MKKRIKFVTVDKIEYREYEDFLNRMGADGWHLSHANAFYQTFEYRPDMKRYYAVTTILSGLAWASCSIGQSASYGGLDFKCTDDSF